MAFGTDPEADSYKPHGHPRECVVYTGTHDNDTTWGWFHDESSAASTRTPEEIKAERAAVLRYVGTDGREIHWDMIRLAMMSVGRAAIVPAQDLLGLGSSARMNLPGSPTGNWGWRLRKEKLTPEVLARWTAMTETYGRAGSGTPAAEGS
jgi:4-alpha-glucanotransferase